MKQLFFYLLLFFLFTTSLAQKKNSFGISTSYNQEEYTLPISVHPDIASASKDTNAKAVRLSANALNLQELEKLQNLSYIFLDNTITFNSYYIDAKAIEQLFRSLQKLEKLRYISIEDPKLLPYLLHLKNLKGLKLQGFDDVLFTKSLPALSKLEILLIQDPLIPVLPASVAGLTSLKQLELDCINIMELPENFGNLKNLVVLQMQLGKIKKVPASFANLTHLKYLKSTGMNAFKTFPLEITKLPELETLIIELKLLPLIPEEIGNLSNIRILEFHEARKIPVLPESISKLSKLEQIFISDATYLGSAIISLEKIDHPFVLTLNRCPYGLMASSLKNASNLTYMVIPNSALPADVKKAKALLGNDRVQQKEY